MHTCAQIYTDTEEWDHFYPMKSKGEAGDALKALIDETRWIPRTIVTDGALEQQAGHWETMRKKHGIQQRWTEPYSPWQNRAEDSVREIKKAIKRHTLQRNSPKRVWCYLGEWVAAVRRLTYRESLTSHFQVPAARY